MLAAFERYRAALQQSPIPKLLLTGGPGRAHPSTTGGLCREHLPNLEVVALGPGRHFLQEDPPDAIGRAVADWIRRT